MGSSLAAFTEVAGGALTMRRLSWNGPRPFLGISIANSETCRSEDVAHTYQYHVRCHVALHDRNEERHSQ